MNIDDETRRRDLLRAMFDAAVAAADPALVLAPALPAPPKGRTLVIGAGKASAVMARALEEAWDGPLEGLVITRYGHAVPCERIRIVEAAHPVPDLAGMTAAADMLNLVEGLSADDLVIALISGGGSALLCLPPDHVGMAAKQKVNEALLASGAPIGEMNAIRKHLSRVKGGRLARAAAPARVCSLVISDVPGDDPALVASGPTIPDPRSRADALAIVARYGLKLPKAARDWLASEAATAPDPADPVFAGNEVKLIAASRLSLAAAADVARAHGFTPHILSDAIEGEARDVGRVHGAIACASRRHQQPFAPPAVLLSGGETTVTLSAEGRKSGRGGRNTEFLLGLALAIGGTDGIAALAADTDGIDGSESNAGAFADGGTIGRLRDLGKDPGALLARNDAWGAFSALDDLLITGPTRTNVNDFRAVLVRGD